MDEELYDLLKQKRKVDKQKHSKYKNKEKTALEQRRKRTRKSMWK